MPDTPERPQPDFLGARQALGTLFMHSSYPGCLSVAERIQSTLDAAEAETARLRDRNEWLESVLSQRTLPTRLRHSARSASPAPEEKPA